MGPGFWSTIGANCDSNANSNSFGDSYFDAQNYAYAATEAASDSGTAPLAACCAHTSATAKKRSNQKNAVFD